jgi:predicted GNAT family acetyltransferase
MHYTLTGISSITLFFQIGIMLTIVKTKINESEAKLLVEQIKFTPKIIGYTLKEWLNAEHIIVAKNENEQLLGACLNYDFAENWTKIAVLFVLEKFRNQGIGKALFYNSVADAMNRQKNVYTLSCNPIVINFMDRLQFTKFNSLLNFPEAYQKHKSTIYFHNLQWLINSYRVQEIIRKKLVYKLNDPFFYGLKSYTDK